MLVATLNEDPQYRVVAEFREGKVALAGLAGAKPDLALIDIGLPDISGIDIIRQVKAAHPNCDVLVITTFGDDHSVFSALEAGAGGYLLKGATSEELHRDLRALRAGGSPLSPGIARKLLDKLANKKPDLPAVTDKGSSLTAREIEILQMIGRGYSYSETAAHFTITTETVHAHLKNIYRKLAVHSKTQAVYEARRQNLIP